MHLDVIDLRKFYYRTKLGRIVQRALRDKVERLFGDTKGQTILGYGFAAPMLRPFLKSSRRVICLMPGQQGVMPWPEGQLNRSVLTPEISWPLATGVVDKMVILHGLETSNNQNGLLEEIWRVLGPGGRVLIIVPNRSGLWARSEKTPFGYGQPYSVSQLETQLRIHKFSVERHMSAMFFPPSHKPFWLKVSKYLEGVGLRGVIPLASGVIIIEATKQIYARPKSGLGATVKNPLGGVLRGIKAPTGKPIKGYNPQRET